MIKGLNIGWTLHRQGYYLLKANKALLLYPLCSGVFCLTLLLFLIKPLEGLFLTLNSTEPHFHTKEGLLIATVLFLLFCVNVVRFLFDCAFTVCTIRFFKEGDFCLKQGVHSAMTALPSILSWVLFHTTIGAFIRVFQFYLNKTAYVEKLLNGLVWRFGIFFVTPLLVTKHYGATQAVKASSQLMQDTFGKRLSSKMGLLFTFLLAQITALFPAYFSYHYQKYLMAGAVVSGILFLTLIALNNSVNSILRSALFLYASEKITPPPFGEKILAQAFESKR